MSDRFQEASATIETVLRKLGLDPHASKVRDEPGTRAWGLLRGSAQVLLMVNESEGVTWVRVIAPVVKLPVEHQRLGFFTRLLELNARAMRNASFGLLNDGVVVVSERPAEGLDANEVEQILKHVGAVADHYDDLFIAEYGVTR
ncbi:MAG: YbjN domain-containing protein [Deltaproteobacteria bacterium]|nr:YbjN domain-containing protein [Deltaproteobacteria bacterium]